MRSGMLTVGLSAWLLVQSGAGCGSGNAAGGGDGGARNTGPGDSSVDSTSEAGSSSGSPGSGGDSGGGSGGSSGGSGGSSGGSNGDASTDAGAHTDAGGAAGIALGVFVSDTQLGGTAPWTPSVIDAFTTMVGGKPTAWHWYEPFSTGFTQSNFDAVSSRGYTPILSWAPSDASDNPISDANVAAGDADTLIHAFAQKAAAWGKPFYLRLGWEMNLSSIGGWGVGAMGNTDADFVAMWKHAHDLFVQDGATNVRWFWCPSEIAATDPPLSTIYPGDAYVDVVGFDAYNWGTTQSWSSWRSLTQTYTLTYDAVAMLTSKPLIVGETGVVEQGGDKATWITQGFLTELQASFPRIIGVVYFDENAPPDWRVNTSTTSLAAFTSVVTSPVYQGHLP
jgi:Glycosyl hydrolase family 26